MLKPAELFGDKIHTIISIVHFALLNPQLRVRIPTRSAQPDATQSDPAWVFLQLVERA